jgi:hypothetical protein
MAFTRLGYLVILMIIATAAAAIAFVLWPDDSSTNDSATRPTVVATVTPGAGAEATVPPIPVYPSIEFERLLPFVRLGAVANIDASDAQQVLVNFRPDFDTSGFGTPSHTFQTTPPNGETIEQARRGAGIAVNEPGGIEVIRR